MSWTARFWSADADASTRAQRAWTVVYVLTMLLEAIALFGAALFGAALVPVSVFSASNASLTFAGASIILGYTVPTVLLILAGVLSLSFTSTGLLRRLIWVKAGVLVFVWAVLILGVPDDPYVPGSCANAQTGCIPRDAAGPR
ncbi:MAG TPA: hypothetical protein VGB53_07830 [Rubricoccaceae bacterium]|jgi:hypothetical protein